MPELCGSYDVSVGYAPVIGGDYEFAVGYGGPAGEYGFTVRYAPEVTGEFAFAVGYRGEVQDALQQLLSNPALQTVPISGGETVYRADLLNLKYGLKLELVDLLGGGTTVIPCVDFSITRPVNGAIHWAAVLGPDSGREFIPMPTTGPFVGGKHRGGDVNDSGVKRYYRATVTTARRTRVYDWLIRNDYGWTLEKDKLATTLIGTDLSEQLVLARDKKFGAGDYKSRRGMIYTVQQIMAAILDQLGIRYRFEFSDSPMAQFTAIGQAMSLLQALIKRFELEWFFDGPVFVVREPRYRPGGPGRWKITDRYQVKRAAFRATGAGITTEKVVEKLDQANNVAAEFEEERFGILGYNTVPFNPPRTSITADVLEARNGSVKLFVYQDANGDAIPGGTTTGPYVGPIPAHSCRFLYLEDPDDPWPPGLKPRCHVVWYAPNPLGLPEQFSKYYRQRYGDSSAKSEWGTRRDPAEQTPEIAFASQAQEIAKRSVENSLRLANILNLDCVLWPWVDRGETISLTLTAAGWLAPTYWYTESVTDRIGNKSVGMSLQLSRKAAPDE